MTTLLKPAALAYARALQEAGFTVYVPNPDPDRHHPGAQGWFHYSRVVNEMKCYGTVSVTRDYSSLLSDHPTHTMPVTPTHNYGSSIIVAPRSNRRDRPRDPLTVEAAKYTAMPQNAAEFIPGISFHNARPWGIEQGVYVPLEAG